MLQRMKEDFSDMVICIYWGSLSHQKGLYVRYKDRIEEIYNAYWEIVEPDPTHISSKTTVKSSKKLYRYKIKDIVAAYSLESSSELTFLLRQHPNNKIAKCEFCNEGYYVTTRTGGSLSCRHKGVCIIEGCNNLATHDKCKDCWIKSKNEYKEDTHDFDLSNEISNEEMEQVRIYDLVTDYGYLLCLKEGSLNLCKIAIDDIHSVKEESDKLCIFFTDEYKTQRYFTWMSARELSEIISEQADFRY